MCRMTQDSGLKTADRWEGNYRLLCGSLDFPWITALGLEAQPPMLLSENEIKWPQHMEAAKQWFIFMIFDEWFLIQIVTSGKQQGRWCKLECPLEPKYLQAAVGHKLFFFLSCMFFFSLHSLSLTRLGSRGVKPVTTPVSAYANLLFCHFIRHGKKTRVPCGCKCDWHRAQLACCTAERRLRRGEGRDGKLGFCSEATQPSDAFTLQLNLDGFLKFGFKVVLELRKGGDSPSLLSVFIFSVKSSCK